MAEARALEIRKNAPWECFDYNVQVIVDDGSTFWFDSAFLVEMENGWWGVCSEHHGVQCYHQVDLTRIAMYKRLPHFNVELKAVDEI
jgi:hypothetical protein